MEKRRSMSAVIKSFYFHRTFLPDSHTGQRFPFVQIESGFKSPFRCASLCSLSNDCQIIAFDDDGCLLLQIGTFESDTRSFQFYSSFASSPEPYYVQYGTTFSNSKAACSLMGGILYTPNSVQEGAELYQTKTFGLVWVGIQRIENTWYDATGKNVTDSIVWKDGKPTDGLNCAYLNSDGAFSSEDCLKSKEFLCLVLKNI
ncbi:UNVERIFIED_CONTAM: hypothetical protein RMT77_015614 [Armadillidium vulgare]